MEVEVIAVLVAFKQLLSHDAGLFAHGDRLHWQYIGGCPISRHIRKEISDAIAIPGPLAWQIKASKFRCFVG